MASFLVAPYTNAMKLGQGFNSYTQKICLDRAVKFEDTLTTNPAAENGPPDRIAQVVSYTSQFLDKGSDVQKSLSVSASLRIEVSGVTAAGSGSFVNENKLKESDLNYLIRVTVTNQTTQISGKCTLVEVPALDLSKFKDVYGDCFISGFIEGGELVAIVSTKTTEKGSKLELKARLEAGYMGVNVIGGARWSQSNLSNDSVTTVNVNWCGGGQIKESRDPWNIESMGKAAAAFPFNVAKYPTRTYAILTKYTSLTSFIQRTLKFQSVSYENATIYTSVLYNDFLEYKRLYNVIIVIRAEPYYYLKSSDKNAYDLTPTSLDKLQADIRMYTDAIVKEVEMIQRNPDLANETIKSDRVAYLPPSIFSARMPVRKPDIDAAGWKWVRVPGKDSPGNDIMNFGNGTACPEEMMQKAYEWEKANPGKYVKGFTTSGELKSKLVHTSELKAAPANTRKDLYVRIQIDSNWLFIPGVDSSGNDFAANGFKTTTNDSGDIDIVDSLLVANGNSQIVAFNSYGWTKNRASFPTVKSAALAGKPYMGLWVRKSALLIK